MSKNHDIEATRQVVMQARDAGLGIKPGLVLAILQELEETRAKHRKEWGRAEAAERDSYGLRKGYEILNNALVEQGERLEKAEAALPAPRAITGEQVNLAGWTCYGIHEPGNYATCEECRDACNDLANFYNNMHRNPIASKTWTGQPAEGGGE